MLKRTGAGKRKKYDVTAGVLDLRRPTVGILNSQPAVRRGRMLVLLARLYKLLAT